MDRQTLDEVLAMALPDDLVAALFDHVNAEGSIHGEGALTASERTVLATAAPTLPISAAAIHSGRVVRSMSAKADRVARVRCLRRRCHRR